MKSVLAKLIAVALISVGCSAPPPLDRFELGGDFSLTDHGGQPFHLSQRRGRVQLLLFGFTSCPDVCPAAMSRLALVLPRLAPPGADVLFVSVDPRHDTPARLTEYAAAWDFDVTGLTGTADEIRAVATSYGASFAPGTEGGVDHSTRIYLLDGDGQVRFLFSSDDSVDDMVRVTDQLL